MCSLKGYFFIRDGLSKQDRPNHLCTKIFVPCFTKDRKLDPKRAVEFYLKRVAELRSEIESEQGKSACLSAAVVIFPINNIQKTITTLYCFSWLN